MQLPRQSGCNSLTPLRSNRIELSALHIASNAMDKAADAGNAALYTNGFNVTVVQAEL